MDFPAMILSDGAALFRIAAARSTVLENSSNGFWVKGLKMMGRMKSLFLLGVLSSFPAYALLPPPTLPPIVRVNGELVSFDNADPIVENGILLVPLRSVFETMGASVEYARPFQLGDIRIRRGSIKVIVKSGSRDVFVDDNSKSTLTLFEMDSPSVNKNGRVLVPLRFVAQAFGASVIWNGDTNTVFINVKAAPKKSLKPASPGNKASEIKVRISSDKKIYKTGETVIFSITAQNQDERPRQIKFPSGQDFDIAIAPVGKNRPRWDWSHDRMFTQALREETLGPGETLSFRATWDQTDNDGNAMPRGEYSVAAKLALNKSAVAPPLKIALAK